MSLEEGNDLALTGPKEAEDSVTSIFPATEISATINAQHKPVLNTQCSPQEWPMPLSGWQLERIHRVIITAFTRDELRRAVRICMDLSFDDYAPDKGFADQLWALIEWADRQDRVHELVRCACDNNKTNAELAGLLMDAQAWDWTRQAPEPVPNASTVPVHNTVTLTGSGAIGGQGGVAAGAGGIAIGGNFTGNINIGTSHPNDADTSDDKTTK